MRTIIITLFLIAALCGISAAQEPWEQWVEQRTQELQVRKDEQSQRVCQTKVKESEWILSMLRTAWDENMSREYILTLVQTARHRAFNLVEMRCDPMGTWHTRWNKLRQFEKALKGDLP